MAKITVFTCDRCGEQAAPLVQLVIRSPERRTTLEICGACEREVRTLLRTPRSALTNGAAKHPADAVAIGLLEDQLQRVREVAADALVRYGEGATLDQLAQSLRDVASDARRPVAA